MPENEVDLSAEQKKLNEERKALNDQKKEMYIENLKLNGYTKPLDNVDLSTLQFLVKNRDLWKQNEDMQEDPKKKDMEAEEEEKKPVKKDEKVKNMKANAGVLSVVFPDGSIEEADPQVKLNGTSESFILNPTHSPKNLNLFRGRSRVNMLPPGVDPDGTIRPDWRMIA